MTHRRKLGIALGSGGARGWCHIGVLKELDAMGVRPALVAGCSMGALVGAAWAGGVLDRLEDWARALTRQRFVSYADVRFGSGGVVKGRAIAEILTSLGLPDRIEDLALPFVAVATDLETGREVWLQEGSLADAVRASISIPGVFAPHYLDGRWLLDGGLINPVPTSASRALGADATIAVNPNARRGGQIWHAPAPEEGFLSKLGSPELLAQLPIPLRELVQGVGAGRSAGPSAPAYLDVMSASIDIMTDFVRQHRQASDPPHLLLDADLMDRILVLELYRAAEAIEEGHRMVRDSAREIRALVQGGPDGRVAGGDFAG
ncbi:patatin-like phospholipase family protein [Rhodalgimonas zhirmunskyi]|uniref:Patatin-like phospholipase family protein n=1 Tax=Rhodalgimonas zhirmunskyi TaxID=2964767 RepID=A0AAJ1X683_9RHOB|nr:patatin-like phospholipase family protein [Rhodoalgimonas zhirmunskyi]MDQ2095241.1 patatin-like phospholipase family protein [Rhodoalgimonas zhirmunskyi]